MGVHDLWKLLGPCGHRISLETISRRKLAIDVSIWLNQFVKFLPTSQPHLLGLLRRLCKLHFYHIKPVFVFDGPAPALKRRTIQFRRRQQARQQDSFERMAERILLEQLKLKSLKDLRQRLEKPKDKSVSNKVSPMKTDDDNDVSIIDDAEMKSIRDLAASTMAQIEEMKDVDEIDDDVDMHMLRSLQAEEYSAGFDDAEELDYGQTPTKAGASDPVRASELVLHSVDEDEEESVPLQTYDPVNYELPESGELDASVLASLPISVQYEMLDQHRQHHHNVSMRKYAAVKHDMNAFSSMQMQSFLKHVEFNQQIDRKRQEMNADHIRDGMPVKRLAGDSRKEFMYVTHKEEDKQKELKEEQSEQDRTTHQLRVLLDRTSHSYISDHTSSMKELASRVWACDECGTRNEDEPHEQTHMCHHCGALRTEQSHGSVSDPRVGSLLLSKSTGYSPAKPPIAPKANAERSVPVYWKCDGCTFLNDPALRTCEICHESRGHESVDYKHKAIVSTVKRDLFTHAEHLSTPVKTPLAPLQRETPPSVDVSPGPVLMSSAESKKARSLRRPRMRLKTMNVKDIVWFDEEGKEQTSSEPKETAPPRNHVRVTERDRDAICISDEEPDTLPTRVKSLTNNGQITNPINMAGHPQSDAPAAPRISLDADWLEAPEPSENEPTQFDDDAQNAELQLALQLSLALAQPSPAPPEVADVALSLAIVHASDDANFDEDVWEDEAPGDPPAVHTVLPVNNEAVVVLPDGDLAAADLPVVLTSPDGDQSAILDDHAIKDVLVMQTTSPVVDDLAVQDSRVIQIDRPLSVQATAQGVVTFARSPPQEGSTLVALTSDARIAPPEQPDALRNEQMNVPQPLASPAPSSDPIIASPQSTSPTNSPDAVGDMYESKYDEESKYDDDLDVDMPQTPEDPGITEHVMRVEEPTNLSAAQHVVPIVRQHITPTVVVDLSNQDEPHFMSLSAEANSSSSPPRRTTQPSSPGAAVAEPPRNTRNPAQFWSSAAQNPSNYVDVAEAERLSNMVTESHVLQSNLNSERAKTERQAQQVTSSMFAECKELLTLFGCPYVDSPAEAEAQCAELELIGLVDGIVTEDSDVFLFGANEVYRHIFEAKKYAERYKTGEVEAKLGLTRESMISLALLLGSDYTAGVNGIGIVNAMEIINAFHIPGQGNAGLVEFREWCYSDSIEKRPVMPVLEQEPVGETDEARDARELRNAELVKVYRTQLFKYKHRNLRRVWHITRDFPSDEIRRGYDEPAVDSSREPFSWSKPRWDDIIEFLQSKFRADHDARRALSNSSANAEADDEWLVMVRALRKSWEQEEERARTAGPVQNRLDRYFDENDQFAEIRSRRINQAVRGLTSKSTVALIRESELENEAKAQAKRARKSKSSSSPAAGKPARAKAAGATATGAKAAGAKRAATKRGRARKTDADEDDRAHTEMDNEQWTRDHIELVQDDEAAAAVEAIERDQVRASRTKRAKTRRQE